jgi:hypothetical protein
MPGKTKSKTNKKNKTSKKNKRGGLGGLWTNSVNITKDGIILREGNVKFNRKMLGLTLNYDNKSVPFYIRAPEMTNSSMIKHELINYLIDNSILCTSSVPNSSGNKKNDCLFIFNKHSEQKKNKSIATSRLFQSNWYSIYVLWSSENRSDVLKKRSMFAIMDRKRDDIVDKNNVDFWFNFKPYFDINEFSPEGRPAIIKELDEFKKQYYSQIGLNFMHQLIFSPTIVKYGTDDPYKNQFLSDAKKQPVPRVSKLDDLKETSEVVQTAELSGNAKSKKEEVQSNRDKDHKFSPGLTGLAVEDNYETAIKTLDKPKLELIINNNLTVPAFKEKFDSINYSIYTTVDKLRDFLIDLIKNNRDKIKSGYLDQTQKLIGGTPGLQNQLRLFQHYPPGTQNTVEN